MKTFRALDPKVTELLVDLRSNARSMDRKAALSLVATYYQIQRFRITQGHRIRKAQEAHIGHSHILGLEDMFSQMEKEIHTWLDAFSSSHPVGIWARGQYGIGPVLASGVLAACDMSIAKHRSDLWAYFGYDPTVVFTPGTKFKHNPLMKALGWKIGEAFVKVCNNPEAYYGKVFLDRKSYEWGKNLTGGYEHLVGQRNYKYADDTEAFRWTSGQFNGMSKVDAVTKGTFDPNIPGLRMIPPVAIHERAKRYAVKRFLSHFWEKLHEHEFPGVPLEPPWIIAHGGHAVFHPAPDAVKGV